MDFRSDLKFGDPMSDSEFFQLKWGPNVQKWGPIELGTHCAGDPLRCTPFKANGGILFVE